jgi:hypothetical protein
MRAKRAEGTLMRAKRAEGTLMRAEVVKDAEEQGPE